MNVNTKVLHQHRKSRLDLYQNDKKMRVWRKKGKAHYDPKHTTSSAKYGGDSVIAWAFMAADETGTVVFIDDADQSSRMNFVVYRASAHIQSKMLGHVNM